MKIIYNGNLVNVEDSLCSPTGWLQGQGIFETIRTVDGKPWAMSRHMRRAVNSSKKVGVRLPGEELIRDCISQLLEIEKHETGMLRISFGDTGNWTAVHLPYTEQNNPARIQTYPQVLPIEGMQIKRFPYNHRLDVLEQVRSAGFDETVLINPSGNISEGAVSNLLVKISGLWFTPPLSDGVLPGVMRALVIENFDVSVRSIAASEIPVIESAFLLSSLRIAQPVSSIDDRELSQSSEFRAQMQAMALRTSVG